MNTDADFAKRSRAAAGVVAGIVAWLLFKMGVTLSASQRDVLTAGVLGAMPIVYGVLHPLLQGLFVRLARWSQGGAFNAPAPVVAATKPRAPRKRPAKGRKAAAKPGKVPEAPPARPARREPAARTQGARDVPPFATAEGEVVASSLRGARRGGRRKSDPVVVPPAPPEPYAPDPDAG